MGAFEERFTMSQAPSNAELAATMHRIDAQHTQLLRRLTVIEKQLGIQGMTTEVKPDGSLVATIRGLNFVPAPPTQEVSK